MGWFPTSSYKDLLWQHFSCYAAKTIFFLVKSIYLGSIWIQLIFAKIKNWKYDNKIIFKCVNNAMGPVNSAWTVHFVSYAMNPCDITVHTHWKKKKKRRKHKRESKHSLSCMCVLWHRSKTITSIGLLSQSLICICGYSKLDPTTTIFHHFYHYFTKLIYYSWKKEKLWQKELCSILQGKSLMCWALSLLKRSHRPLVSKLRLNI